LLAKRGTLKVRPSSHLHIVPNQSNKGSPQTFQTALILEKFPFLILIFLCSDFRRTDSHGKYRKISSTPKGDFSSALLIKNIILKPGSNEFVVKSKVCQHLVVSVRYAVRISLFK